MRKVFVLNSIRGEESLNLMIDDTIYDSNSNFRLVLYSKFKAQPKKIVILSRGYSNFRDERITLDFAYFQSTLISFSPPDVVKLNMITINADDCKEIAMDIDNVQLLEVKNDMCVAPLPVNRSRAVTL